MTRKPASPMTEFDRQVERIGKQKITVRQGGETRTISATEAVLNKRTATALAGSAHAQRQYTQDVRLAEERRLAEIAADNDTWAGIRRRHLRIYAAHRAVHGCDPALFPHPEDIEITPGKPVRLTGPLDADAHQQMLRRAAEIEALFWQDALDRARSGRRNCPDIAPGSPVWLATLLNHTLPPRLQRTSEANVANRMQLSRLPLRTLLKETRAAWRRAGQDRARGEAFAAPEQVMTAATMLRDLGRAVVQDDAALDRPEETAARIHRKWLG